LPLISITGVTGTFFRALAVTVAVSLLTSLALALTWTPNLSQYFIRSRGGEAEGGNGESEAFSAERLLAAEEATMRGTFGRIIGFYERWLRRALQHPWWLLGLSAVLIVIAVASFYGLGTDLLPAMDEGAFVLDYTMPPGSSLQETNRVVTHIEQMLHAIPEVQGTSRRTGLQLGLAAVTEANTGDISVKLKENRSRGIDEIIAEARAEIGQKEPAIDVEFVQTLQDMIGDLTGAPEPIQIKLFSTDAAVLAQWAPKVADAIQKVKGVVDVSGIENTISGPAVMFQVDPAVAARAGFTPQEVAIDASA